MIGILSRQRIFTPPRLRIFSSIQRYFGSVLETKYTDSEKEKILCILNEDISSLSRYDITKVRIKKLVDFIGKHGVIKTLSEVETIDGFTEKTTTKFFKSLLNGPQENENISKKIKGQILHPALSESDRQSCKSVLAVYVTVNSICWSLVQKQDYVVNEWKYHGIDYPDGKKMQITDVLNTAWNISKLMPHADLYVMKAEATTLRATGSDPNNPKVLGINLQKAQLVAMIVALLNARSFRLDEMSSNEDSARNNQPLKQRVYFLRPTLPFRLYGTLIGNERVSTDQTVEEILREANSRKSDNHVFVPESLVEKYRNLKELQKDMLGSCLLLALTFMDICIYRNKDSINKLLKRGE